ncbi:MULTISPECIES: hypothetical protein [Streptacidiphilus]|uniref:PBP domain-containing protein n=1 Tax=Streptacidiphilus cavernicola TaxID=3342716 RepID=A0ABV6UQQ2_9ACTN|nr:hypothetical protein [Streptacidiphilus jeojiense]
MRLLRRAVPTRVALRSRILRTVAAAAVLVTAGLGYASQNLDRPATGTAAVGSAASPSIQVDPMTGSAVPIDPAAGSGSTTSGSGTAVGGSTAGPKAPVVSATESALLPGHPVAASAAAVKAVTGSSKAVSPAAVSSAEGSAVTVTGSGPFAGLAVTVAQTVDLVDQVVQVTWTGGKPTQPNPTTFATDYLELMECWGDAATGPDRTQCEYGADRGDSRGGDYVASRQLNYGNLVDPAEPLKQTKPNVNVYTPFTSWKGVTESGADSQFFDAGTTNEVPFAPTRANGTGQVFFETMTGMEAAGLGCGEVDANQKTTPTEGRQCWLVVVPRGETEVDGNPPSGNSGKLESSPLSTSNWAHRLVVPLHFAPLGLNCPIGANEQLTFGSELVEEAIVRWQPVLCRKTTSIFGYTPNTDNSARQALTAGTDPGLEYITDPVPVDSVKTGATPVYAPLTLSGVTIAFDVQSQSYSGTPAATRLLDGQRIPQIKLTPRLVAKLLTQSYRYAVNYQATDVQSNPLDLTSDPDFLALNPAFADLYFPSRIPDMLVPEGQSDTARHLWAWVLADPDARAFLSGTKDPWGMVVNPNYTLDTLNLPRDDFPKKDPFCQQFPNDPDKRPAWCTQDAHPYALDLHDAARSASRGDTLSKSIWDATATPPQLKKGNPEPQGQIGILAVTDTATAARYGLDTAELLNGNGEYVAPTADSLLAGAAAMTEVPGTGVLTESPTTKAAGAYPLTMVSYAATVPTLLQPDEGAAYASLIRFAVGDGQTPGVAPGQLGDGYVPLPESLRTTALAAAQTIVDDTPKTTAGSSPSSAPSTGKAHASATAGSGGSSGGGSTGGSGTGGSTGGSGSKGAGGSGGTGSGGSGGSTGAPSPSPSHSTVVLAPSATPVVTLARTARTDAGAFHYLLLGLLAAGAAAALAGPLLPRYLRRRRS